PSCPTRSSPSSTSRAALDRCVTLRLRVPDAAAGERLDRFLATATEIGSRAAAERLLEEGHVRVDGEPRAKSHRLAGGEEVELELQIGRASCRERVGGAGVGASRRKRAVESAYRVSAVIQTSCV